ncbi:MAG TPA: glycosyltransferase [Usitatibacter sp.]|nr:glycosyltransferase [Usitatibacter sp.]
MKIAIVAPCPIPYMVGGAEKLWWGLAQHFNERTAHQAEIIKLPSPEGDLRALMRSYESFAALDLAAFDLVVSGKYPAWMVSHPRHVCYMLHRLRGLYDCYPGGPGVPSEAARHPPVAALREFMRRYRGARSALAELFGRWNEIAAEAALPPGVLDFPGPLARELVHWLDDIALAPGAISRYAAISHTLVEREGYFPPGVEVAVAHPPPHRVRAPGERYEHFYTVSRLDGPKRVALVVEAMRMVKTDLPLFVGGTGPEEARLREIARGDPRIRFVGFESDAEVDERYRNALAVPFVPWQEDYGFITVEAMQCGKPVITTRDSGGPRELVEDGVNGLVCGDDAASLAAAMQKLADDRELAQRLGRNGIQRAARVTWEAVAEALLAKPAAVGAHASASSGPKRKLVVASTFGIHPPRHGGQMRTLHLFRALAPEFETVVVSLGRASEPPFAGEIAPGVREVRVPVSEAHEREERKVAEKMGTPVTDVVMPRLHALTPAIAETLAREARDATAVVASHPYLYPVLRGLGRPVWYEAQDFELHMKTALFEKLEGGAELIAAVREAEGACARGAEVILCASPDDAQELVDVYGVERGRILDTPNGTDALRVPFTAPHERAALKARMGVGQSPLAFFMGSGHWPNIEAVKRIFEFALALPEVAFVVMGSVCYAFDPRLKPGNVLFVGEVDEVTRNLCLQACDVALNPMEHGSGTNLKMLDYFAAGLPVITTARGSRGLRLSGERECLVREVDEFPAAISGLLDSGAEAAAERARVARALVDEHFDWQAIGERIKPRLLELADGAPRSVVKAA